jgi:hypothetical protein
MTEGAARTTSTLLLTTAGIAAAYIVLRSPSLRRVAGRATRTWLGTVLPIYLAHEIRRAWREPQTPRPTIVDVGRVDAKQSVQRQM